jgi:hypothetical protein
MAWKQFENARPGRAGEALSGQMEPSAQRRG